MNKTLVQVLVVGAFIIAGGIAFETGLFPLGENNTQVANISISPNTFTRTLKQGDSGDDVRKLQEYLRARKYLSQETTIAYFDGPTENAVRLFQSDNALDKTGVVDIPTLKVLNQQPLETGIKSLKLTRVDANVTLKAEPSTITRGQSATLTWSATNVSSCTINNQQLQMISQKETSSSPTLISAKSQTTTFGGTQVVIPTTTTTYTLKCLGTTAAARPLTQSVVVTVTEVAVNGSCGTAHNQTFSSAPTTNLCATGVASPVPVSGNGPWTWSCLGSNGGTNASCRANATSSIVYSAPITISKGGTYTGNWESNDPAIPAVNIITSAPVIIENCNIRSKGHHISSLLQETNVTVRNCTGYGVNPNKLNARMGRFINLWKPNSLVAERNTMDHTAGIYIASAGSSTSKISIRFNKAKNLDGRLSDGANGYLSSFFPAQFVQFNFVQSAKNVEVAWNEIINEPWNSRPEDNINLYDTSGTADSPILIHDNYIQGAYPVNPLTDPYSGGGIIVEGPSNTMSSASGYVQIYNNQVISASNHGISIDGGHDSIVRDNTVISSGLLPDGSRIYSANVGLLLWDYYNSINKGTFYNNHVINNTVGWIRRSGDRNDWWFPHCNVAQSTCNGNVQLPSPITRETEKLQHQVWLDKLGKNSIVIGAN